MKSGYQRLSEINVGLEIQLSHLKVETDQYKEEILKLKKELKDKAEAENIVMLSQSGSSDKSKISASDTDQNVKNAQIKLQLDEFIEDIDQCIQIIQSKE